MIKYSRDIVEEAQQVMNDNKSLANKGLISSLTNEVVALRHEVERLEAKLHSGPGSVKSVLVSFDRDGKVDGIESHCYE